jgi:flagellar M-ring protein FliF
MNDFVKKLFTQVTTIFKKLTLVQKLVGAGVILVIVIVLAVTLSTTGKPTQVSLYEEMNAKDFGAITKKLGEWDYKFVTRGASIWVNPKDREYIKMKLAQENLIPQGLKGWELFDTEKWTTTDFERNVNKRRAIIGEITRHIKLLDDVEDVSIEITMPETQLYVDAEKPITASIIITPAPYSDILKNPDKIKGIINLVAFGVDGLEKDSIVVTDNHGNILSDFSAEEKTGFLEIAKKEYKIKEALRRQMLSDVRDGLKRFIGTDNVDMNLEMELDFDQQELEKIEYIPMTLKADNPLTPYDESVVQDTVVRSKKNVKEDFEGPGFVPEGPPNVEPNLPPGYKEAANKYAKYKKTEDIVNNEIGEQKSKIKKAPYQIRRLSIAVWVDGKWEKLFTQKGELAFTNKQIKREYRARTDEEMQKIAALVKGSIGYSPARGDQVIVQNVPFDRTKQFEAEDLREWKKLQMKKALIISLVLLLAIFLVTLLVRYLQKEAERRRRLREEELARQQELLRLQALAEAEKGDMEPSLSLEERARLEMEENAKNLAKEHPDSVAKLLRTWMSE